MKSCLKVRQCRVAVLQITCSMALFGILGKYVSVKYAVLGETSKSGLILHFKIIVSVCKKNQFFRETLQKWFLIKLLTFS